MLDERTRLPPIPEAVRIVKRIAADHGDESEEEQPNHQENLEDGHVELRDAKVTHCYCVQQGIDDDHQHDDDLNGNFVRPESDHDIHGHNLKWYQDCHVQEEVPCHGKPKGAIYPFATEADEG